MRDSNFGHFRDKIWVNSTSQLESGNTCFRWHWRQTLILNYSYQAKSAHPIWTCQPILEPDWVIAVIQVTLHLVNVRFSWQEASGLCVCSPDCKIQIFWLLNSNFQFLTFTFCASPVMVLCTYHHHHVIQVILVTLPWSTCFRQVSTLHFTSLSYQRFCSVYHLCPS